VEHSAIVGIGIGYHPKHLGISDIFSKRLQGLFKVLGGQRALLLLVELHEALPDIIALFALLLFLLFLGEFHDFLLVVGHLNLLVFESKNSLLSLKLAI